MQRLIHFSALNASPTPPAIIFRKPSRFLQSKVGVSVREENICTSDPSNFSMPANSQFARSFRTRPSFDHQRFSEISSPMVSSPTISLAVSSPLWYTCVQNKRALLFQGFVQCRLCVCRSTHQERKPSKRRSTYVVHAWTFRERMSVSVGHRCRQRRLCSYPRTDEHRTNI